MKAYLFPRLAMVACLAFLVASVSSCMTTYDANGNPVQSVDPGTAAAGAVAAGVIGYAIANDRSDNNHYYRRGGNYYRGGRYYRSGGRHYNSRHRGGHRGGRHR